MPVTDATLSRHSGVLRESGLPEQRDAGPKRPDRLRRAVFGARLPGLLDPVLRQNDGSGGETPGHRRFRRQ